MRADKTTKASSFCVLPDGRGEAWGQTLWAFTGSHVNSTNAFALSLSRHTGDSFRQLKRPIKLGTSSGSARTAGAPRSPPYWTRKRWQRAPSPFCPNDSLLKVLKEHFVFVGISNKCFIASDYLDYYIHFCLINIWLSHCVNKMIYLISCHSYEQPLVCTNCCFTYLTGLL